MKFTRETLLAFHAQMSEEARILMSAKNHDYAGSEGIDPFANFRRSEAMGITSTGQAMLVRMTDKFSRLATFCQGGVLKVQDESLTDTCLDLVNYAVLFAAWAKEVKDANTTATPTTTKPSVQALHFMSEFQKHLRDGTGKSARKGNARRRSAGRSRSKNRKTVHGKGGARAQQNLAAT